MEIIANSTKRIELNYNETNAKLLGNVWRNRISGILGDCRLTNCVWVYAIFVFESNEIITLDIPSKFSGCAVVRKPE